jgi:hypothetical protein
LEEGICGSFVRKLFKFLLAFRPVYLGSGIIPLSTYFASQLSERSKASKAAVSGKHDEALIGLQRALAIVKIVRAQQPVDQAEIDANKVLIAALQVLLLCRVSSEDRLIVKIL